MNIYTLRPDIFTLNFNLTLSGTVTSFNLQSKIMERYETLKGHPHKVAVRTAHIGGILMGISQAMMMFYFAFGFWWMSELMSDCTANYGT
jgi:hypothetical protein